MFYCLVVGSRTFNDYDLMCEKLDYLLMNYSQVAIVSGGAKGADTLAEKYAKEHNYPLRVYKADWNAYGKRAGFLRNEEMHKCISIYENKGVVAFWDGNSSGTAHNFELAIKYNNPIRIYNYVTGCFITNPLSGIS